MKGAVEVNMGGGTPVGPDAWKKWNVNVLTDLDNADPISGFPVYKALLCQVEKLEEATTSSKRTAGINARMTEKESFFNVKAPQKARSDIYLDNNATTRLDPAVRDAMLPYLDESHGNPSSIHSRGRKAGEAVENARRQVAKLIHARPREIIFTGGGSESDNTAIKGIAVSLRKKGDHIVTSSAEHPAVLEACAYLEKTGFKVTYLDVDSCGSIDPTSLEKAITAKTILVTLMMANNEVGTILPLKELCLTAHKKNVLFHTDAVQAAGKITVDVRDLDVDLLSLSGHKYHGPKGVGALYLKKGVEIEPLIHGGKQETALRAGTHNVPAIVGLGKASEVAFRSLGEFVGVKTLRDRLEKGIVDIVPDARLNGPEDGRLPNTLNMTLPRLRGESLVIALDQHGVALSSGSACKSGSPEPTHVLLAMGRSEEDAHCSVRFSLSRFTTEKDIEETLSALKKVLEEMESTIRFLPCK
jgi:cysteine desulfurase NifS